MRLSCPICKKSSEFEDVGVGWKCPTCTGHVFSEYTDKNGKVHRYCDYNNQSELAKQTPVFDLDSTDIMTGNPEPGPFYSLTFAKLAKLADQLDEKGHSKEADEIDEVLGSKDFIDPKQLPEQFIYSLSGEPMANL